MGDAQPEQMNWTIINMLKTFPKKIKNWIEHLDKLSFPYNNTINKTVGFTQVYLMFGRHSRLQLAAMFQINEQTTRSNLSYLLLLNNESNQGHSNQTCPQKHK